MESLERVRQRIGAVKEQVGRVLVGQEPIVDGVLACFLSGGHALLEGVPGVGKTLLVKTLAQAMHLGFSRVQFTPDLMPADVVGTMVVDELPSGQRAFRFQPGPVFANVILADEVNRASPKTQSALLEAMQEQHVTVAGTSHPLPAPFCVLATQNPLEMEGTFPLPEAQLDRFMLKLMVPFPSLDELAEILARTTGPAPPAVEPVLDADEVLALRAMLRTVPVAPPVVDYALRLVLATHPDQAVAPPAVRNSVRVGASPRAAQALVMASRHRAVTHGRDAVSFEDVRSVAPDALRHRILLSFEGEASGRTAEELVGTVLEHVPELQPALEREAARS